MKMKKSYLGKSKDGNEFHVTTRKDAEKKAKSFPKGFIKVRISK